MSKELDRLLREPNTYRRNYRITKRCQTCNCCVENEKGKHTISFKCNLDDKSISLVGTCDEWMEIQD